MRSRRSGVSRPRPTGDWFVTTTRPSPRDVRSRIASIAPGMGSRSSGSSTYPFSTLIVPSRSRSTKRLTGWVSTRRRRRRLAPRPGRTRTGRTDPRAAPGPRGRQVGVRPGSRAAGARRDVRVHPLLALVGLAEHRSEVVEPSGLDRVSHLVGEGLELLHALDRLLAPLVVQADLRVDEAEVRPRPARVAEHQVRAKAGERVVARRNRGDHDARRGELDEVEAAERGRVLILPSARDAEVLTLDRVARPCELLPREAAPAERRERRNGRGHERGGAAEAASRGRVVAQVDVHAVAEPDAMDRR